MAHEYESRGVKFLQWPYLIGWKADAGKWALAN